MVISFNIPVIAEILVNNTKLLAWILDLKKVLLEKEDLKEKKEHPQDGIWLKVVEITVSNITPDINIYINSNVTEQIMFNGDLSNTPEDILSKIRADMSSTFMEKKNTMEPILRLGAETMEPIKDGAYKTSDVEKF